MKAAFASLLVLLTPPMRWQITLVPVDVKAAVTSRPHYLDVMIFVYEPRSAEAGRRGLRPHIGGEISDV